MSRRWVLDASALLALLNNEPGGGLVAEAINQMERVTVICRYPTCQVKVFYEKIFSPHG